MRGRKKKDATTWAGPRPVKGGRGRGEEACGPAGSWTNKPKARKRGEKRFCFSFSIALFQIHFQKVFETF
jgi:hypothetical protein